MNEKWIPLENEPELFMKYADELFGTNIYVADIYAPECITDDSVLSLLFDIQ